MPHVRRVSDTGSYKATYTLDGKESFQLDTASWTAAVAADGDVAMPILRIADPSGAIIAEVAPQAASANFPPNPFGFSYTGPAVLADSDSILPPNVYTGYLMHDFGGIVVTNRYTTIWNQPPWEKANVAIWWLRSPGAVTLSPVIGQATVIESRTVTVPLTAGVAAGAYCLVVVQVLGPTEFVLLQDRTGFSVTTNVAGGVLDFSGQPWLGMPFVTLPTTRGLYTMAWMDYLRAVNPMVAGDTVTVTVPNYGPVYLSVSLHEITGLTVGNPIGPNAGGNFVADFGTVSVSPATHLSGPVPKFVGPVMFMGTTVATPDAFYDVMMERGGVATLGSASFPPLPAHRYAQVALPELHLSPGSTVTATSINLAGQPRVADVVTDFLLYGPDESEIV